MIFKSKAAGNTQNRQLYIQCACKLDGQTMDLI